MCEGVDLPHFDKSVVTQAWSCQLFLQIKMGSHTASECKKLDAALPAVCWREFDRSFVTQKRKLEQSEAINNLIQHLRWYLRRLPTCLFCEKRQAGNLKSNECPLMSPFLAKRSSRSEAQTTHIFPLFTYAFLPLPAYILANTKGDFQVRSPV